MRDIFFFAGAAAALALIISVSLIYDPRGAPTMPVSVGSGPRDLVRVDELNLNRFRTTPRDTISMIRREDQPYFVKITSRRNSDFPTNARDVANIPLATDLELAFAQRNLKITITARSSTENGSPAMRAKYSASSDHSSAWYTFLLTPEWEDYSFYFSPPESPNERGLDFLAVWADPDGLGRGVEVQKIEFDARS